MLQVTSIRIEEVLWEFIHGEEGGSCSQLSGQYLFLFHSFLELDNATAFCHPAFLYEGNSHQEDHLSAKDFESSNSEPSGSIPLRNPGKVSFSKL